MYRNAENGCCSELAPRLQEVFPYIKVAALYGGSVDKEKDAVLVVATTHQLLRYYRAFHVMVVDEIDAFPYCAIKCYSTR